MRGSCLMVIVAAFVLVGAAHADAVTTQSLIDLDFNSGVDSLGNSTGDLVFNGLGDFQVTFTDDESDGPRGGNADGVHITNQNHANIKVGTSDLVLGAFNEWDVPGGNYHSSGIVAVFNQGVDLVRLFDTDNDSTPKTLYAFDELGNLIGQTAAGSQMTFTISLADTVGQAIYSVEFDTLPGVLGGAEDGTYFTIDDFYVEGPSEAPEPASMATLLIGAVAIMRKRRKA